MSLKKIILLALCGLIILARCVLKPFTEVKHLLLNLVIPELKWNRLLLKNWIICLGVIRD